MKRMNLKRSAALALAAVTIAGSLVVPSNTAQAAGKKTVYVVTESQGNGGGKTKYSYNKKGLISKAVYTDTEKSKSEEVTYKDTTSYSYNKKNKIASSKSEYVRTSVDYDTYGGYNDIYEGERMPAVAGKNPSTTVYKSTTDTAYTYDKKGNLTTKVETCVNTTIPENGTSTDTVTSYGYIPARYQEDPNGNYLKSEYSDYYYYEDDTEYLQGKKRYSIVPGTGVDDVRYQYTTTSNVAVTANADGSVTTTTTTTSSTLDSANSTATNIVLKSSTSTSVFTTSNKSTTTTTYTYDKKKRAKTAVATTVYTSSTVYSKTDADGDKTDRTSTTERTSKTTDTYTYNKKGKATKVVTKSEPDVKSVSSSTDTYTYTYNNKTTTSTTTTNTTTENGQRTTVTSHPSNGTVTSTTRVVPYPANSSEITTTFKYDKKGNVKSYKATTKSTDNRRYVYTMNADGTHGEQQYVKRTDEDGDIVNDYPVYTTKVTTSTTTNSKEVELKKNTARLTKAIGMTNTLAEGESNTSYNVSRVAYKVKAKKVAKSAASAANKQQWILQNGSYNGEMGL